MGTCGPHWVSLILKYMKDVLPIEEQLVKHNLMMKNRCKTDVNKIVNKCKIRKRLP